MKMKLFQPIFRIISGLSLVSIIAITGCQGGQKGESPQSGQDQQTNKEALIREVFNYPLPTSFEVTTMLNDAGAPFIVSLGNDPGKVGNYITQSRMALNLGIYGADLCYASTYNQSQETMSYLNASKKLIDALNIETSFNQEMVERIESNLQQKDSLIRIISDSFYDTYNFLMTHKQDKTSALIMAGSWVEALYITTQIALTSHKNDKMLRIVTGHHNSLKKLIGILEPLQSDTDIAPVYNDLKKLNEEYNSLGTDLKTEHLAKLGTSIDNIRQGYIR